MTFIAFTIGFPVACSLALWQGEGRPWVAAPVQYLRGPVRAAPWRWLWAGAVRFGKKLLFAVMINASDFDPVALPLAVFLSLVGVLALQVRSWAPHIAHRHHTAPRCPTTRASVTHRSPNFHPDTRAQVTVRPYKSEHDNHFEAACLCALMYGYFASVRRGARSTLVRP